MPESEKYNEAQKSITFDVLTVKWRLITIIFTALVFFVISADTVAGMLSAHPGDTLKGVADLVRAIAWPISISIVLIYFRSAITNQLPRVTKVTVPGGSIELERIVSEQLQEAATEAQTQTVEAIGNVSQEDLQRARAVDRAATNESLPEFKNKMLDLAAEYRQVRGSMPSGEARTRAMSVLVAQMRTLGQAAYPFRGELAFNDDPGQRIAAIAIAQVQPDPTMLGWLASRIGPTERPFVQYHALLALLIAIRNGDASEAVGFDHAYRTAQLGYDGLSIGERTDRADLLAEIREEVTRLRGAFAAFR